MKKFLTRDKRSLEGRDAASLNVPITLFSREVVELARSLHALNREEHDRVCVDDDGR
ncbi:MAG: hypothetical protein JOZ30_03985 [Hyphomicrobiales bacterium]|nr:hypothetical protein [Hyphomicrobiales bacterium]